jgi:hypothetical protein
MEGRLFTFVGGSLGSWRVTGARAVTGEALPAAERIDIVPGSGGLPGAGAAGIPGAAWALKGVISNERYVTRPEKTELVAKQEGLGRAKATCGVLIPIRKNAAWWALTQDERRAVFEEQSAHIAIGMRALPAIARRLHHCRDLGEAQPFDFLTWFEFAPGDAQAFDGLLEALRATPEWSYVDREVDIRLIRES